ncbi:MAG TPA: excinuclease ABC subunit UvrA [Candidatus Dormibacteraeota bacterium]|nr:excinuclease ABC subunit UvrA [Candidatus Dormibacteraeota bacterium]
MGQAYISIRGAREHNLRDVDLDIPRDRLTVITGLSGSGKSSLAFDTIYAEGQRRYVESLSAYARQFLGQMEKPDVDHIDGLSPAISIDQKGAGRNPRSTVGTVTEVYDYLRLLYARVGHPHCPKCGREISRQTVEQIADQVSALPLGSRLLILAPMIQGRKGEHLATFELARRQGYVRVRVDGRVHSLDQVPALDKRLKHDVDVVVDRLVLDRESLSRLRESCEQASQLSGGTVLVAPAEDQPGLEDMLFSEQFACVYDSLSMEEPQPRNFSFNNPHGACPDCTGLGARLEVDPDAVVSDPEKSISQGVISGWSWGPAQQWMAELIEAVARENRIPLDRPWRRLQVGQRDLLLYGLPKGETVAMRFRSRGGRMHNYEAKFEGVIPNLERRYRETESAAVKEGIERLMMQRPCPTCKGKRLRPEFLAVTVAGLGIMDFCAQPVDQVLTTLAGWRLSDREELIARRIIKEIRERVGFLFDVGLQYLTLDRAAATLSGGEAQRIRLATQIGSRLTGVLYILDEPSIGLHQRDNGKLLATLFRLRDLGNTVVVVEHDEETIRSADFVVDMGPGAGEHGGHVVAAGSLAELLESEGSLTAQYLRGERRIEVPQARRPGSGQIVVRGARANNLRNLDVRFPLRCLVGVSGVSGSGKSTLVNDILYRSCAQHFYSAKQRPAVHDRIDGLDQIDKVVDVDQAPIGRTPRSNPATYTGLFTPIRELFAQLPEARARGYKPGRFSFNVRGGRCEACEGDGLIKIEMHFLPDIYVTCEVCKGQRYTQEVLEVRFKGHSIADVLGLSVAEAAAVFRNQPGIARKLQTLVDVGLGYLHLGQPATQLSGGEAQRVKLATELSRRSTGSTLYILDEPTTGLHFADVGRLLEVLHRLVEQGNTVVVIEHNLDVLKAADWLIDLGPDGGAAGGAIVAEGTPEEVASSPASSTGSYLRAALAATAQHSAPDRDRVAV